jgi:hypothetical protein
MTDTDTRLSQWGATVRSMPTVPPDLETVRRRAHQRRARERRRIATCAAVVVALVVVGAARELGGRTDGGLGVVSVTSTTEVPRDVPIAQKIEGAVTGGITLLHEPDLQAGGLVQIVADPAVAGDTGNDGPRVCFDWGDAMTCDPSAWDHAERPTTTPVAIRWNRRAPGWAMTPAGLRSCADLRCVVLLIATDGTPHISSPIDVEPGPRPRLPARIEHIGDDGTIDVRLDSTVPDASWTAWAREQPAPALAGLPAFGIVRCAAVATWTVCDALHPNPPVPVSDGPTTVHLPPARDLFTPLSPDPWVDCARVACALAVTKRVGVATLPGGAVGASDVLLAWVPYQVPESARHAVRPTITVDPPGPLSPDQDVTATVHHAGIDRTDLEISECGLRELTAGQGCPGPLTFAEKVDDHTSRARVTIRRCLDPDGCVLAVRGVGGEGYPPIARTPRLHIAG